MASTEAPFIAIARERVPDAELVIGGMESLPFEEGEFDVVMGFNAFEFAADPALKRCARRRASASQTFIVIVAWSCPVAPRGRGIPQ